jgi:hypothetical protein
MQIKLYSFQEFCEKLTDRPHYIVLLYIFIRQLMQHIKH